MFLKHLWNKPPVTWYSDVWHVPGAGCISLKQYKGDVNNYGIMAGGAENVHVIWYCMCNGNPAMPWLNLPTVYWQNSTDWQYSWQSFVFITSSEIIKFNSQICNVLYSQSHLFIYFGDHIIFTLEHELYVMNFSQWTIKWDMLFYQSLYFLIQLCYKWYFSTIQVLVGNVPRCILMYED